MPYLPPLREPVRQIGRRRFDFDREIVVMGIVNRTPDSFFDQGRTYALDRAVDAALAAAQAGAPAGMAVGGVASGMGSSRAFIPSPRPRRKGAPATPARDAALPGGPRRPTPGHSAAFRL